MSEEITAIQQNFNHPAIYNVRINLSVVLGSANLRVHQLLKLGRGAVVELERKANEPVEVFANDILVAKGEVVITGDDMIGVTLTDLVSSSKDL
ncbi:MAG: flagellar motor switch protein FliN [Alphaproteobacteria bacterium]